jgi:NitT/TauT family transport system permease protein
MTTTYYGYYAMLNIELKKYQQLWLDISFLIILVGIVYLLIHVYTNLIVPYKPLSSISLLPVSLIAYSIYSLIRMLAAYALSLMFALGYGYMAARTRFGEIILVPLLDILQSIPVLSLMPAIVLFLISMFPKSNTGLELAAIVMIFTAMAWNMAFAVYQSLKSIPKDLAYVSRLYQFSKFKRFIWLEMPYSAISLIWNSMMSFAGGWFFLSVNEAFVLGNRSFRLQGIGAYMSVAQEHGNTMAMIYSLIAMGIIIILVDRLLWRPLIVWSDKFKIEDTGNEQAAKSFVLNYLNRLMLIEKLHRIVVSYGKTPKVHFPGRGMKNKINAALSFVLKPMLLMLLSIFTIFILFGVYKAGSILGKLTYHELIYIVTSVALTFARVMATLAIGIAWAVPVGVYIGLRRKLAAKLQPVVQFFASYPAPMLYPIALLVLQEIHVGLGIGSVVLMLLGAQWYILYNTISGAMSISEDLIDVKQLFNIRGLILWKKIIIPAIAPQLITGIITAAGGAWNASIVAEYVLYKNKIVYTRGIGTLINLAIEHNNFHLLLGGTFAMIAVVVIINITVWKRLYKSVSQLHQLES